MDETYEVWHPEAETPAPKFLTRKGAEDAARNWNKDCPGHIVRPVATEPAIKESLTTDGASPAPGIISRADRCPKCSALPDGNSTGGRRVFFACGSHGYEGMGILTNRTDLCYEREEVQNLKRETTALRSKMTEAWKLVHAMSGQEYWDRAEQWLDESKEFKPEGFVG